MGTAWDDEKSCPVLAFSPEARRPKLGGSFETATFLSPRRLVAASKYSFLLEDVRWTAV